MDLIKSTRDDEEAVDIPRTIAHLENQIESRKRQIETYLSENSSIDVSRLTDECRLLYEKSVQIDDEVVHFERYVENELIDNILSAAFELQNLTDDLEGVQFGLGVLERLIDFDERLKIYHRQKKQNDLAGTVSALANITDSINDFGEAAESVELFQKIKSEQAGLWEQTLDELSDLWKNNLTWSENSVNDSKIVTIKIDNSNSAKRNQLLEALVASNQIHIEMKKFSKFLYNHVLNPLIYQNATMELLSKNLQILQITFSPPGKTKPNYENVLNNLKSVFEFLSINLNYEKSDDINLIKIIGELTCADFSEALIKDCLVHTIPNCISELQDYGKVTSQVEIFQKYLSSIHFFESDNVSILQYANNIDILFANKTSQYFLENARLIVKKDLSNTMSVGSETVTPEKENISRIQLDGDDIELLDYFYQSFEVSPFRFPRCAISRSVHELLDLVILMMEQAVEASDLCARRLYYTARNVFELYMAVVPLHHKQLLETMPQQIALFHNNCIYLAHHLLILGPKWQKNFAGRDLSYNIVFYDQVKELRDLATHTLLTHMRAQRKQLLDTIRSSDIYYIAIKDVLSENAEQAIRQCIRQLQVLKTVWSGIFPSDVYRRLITCLANVFVEELVCKVINQEDITADVATQLTDLYKIVLNRLPQIYNDESIIHNNVVCWLKFNELILVLGGNLATIEERWFNGNGPLALQFKPDEIKRLIRALFQNTTFRANLLSKIK